jgi:hypothetical protein
MCTFNSEFNPNMFTSFEGETCRWTDINPLSHVYFVRIVQRTHTVFNNRWITSCSGITQGKFYKLLHINGAFPAYSLCKPHDVCLWSRHGSSAAVSTKWNHTVYRLLCCLVWIKRVYYFWAWGKPVQPCSKYSGRRNIQTQTVLVCWVQS